STLRRLHLACRRLARTRGLRPQRCLVYRPPRFAAHLAGRGLGGPSAAQGLRIPAGIPRHSRAVIKRVNERRLTAWPQSLLEPGFLLLTIFVREFGRTRKPT